jgi:capsular polysaccharide transport system permease protein
MKWVDRLSARLLLTALIVAPLALALLYFVFLAADRYVSESAVVVRSANQSAQPSLPGAAMLLSAGISMGGRDDTLVLREYVQSLDMLQRLDDKLHVREHFAQHAGRDPIYRLYDFYYNQERFLDYFRNRVELLMNDESGVLTIRVQGFDAEFAQTLNRSILQESERFINELSQNMGREQLTFAEGELTRTSGRLQMAKLKLLDFQSKHKLLDPMADAQAAETLAAGLQVQLSAKEAELKQAVTYLNEDSYQVKALRGQVTALRSQVEQEQHNATRGSKNGAQLSIQAAQFQDLKLAAGFAEDAYKLALTAVENARIEATRKIKSVAVIAQPSRPQISEYPRRIYNLVTLAALCVLLYGVARLVVATIRDHQD